MRQYARWITIQALWKDSWCQSTRFIFYCVTFIKFSASQYLSLLICKLRSCCNTLYLLEVEWDNTKIWNNRLRCLQQGLALIQFSSVQFSHSVMADSLWPHGMQHARLPCPSPTPGAYSNSCPSCRWCHPTISFSVIPFSCHLQSFPASGSFPMSWLFTSGGQNIGVSALESVLPMNIHDWFPLGLIGWISLQSKGPSRVFSNTTVQKHQFFGTQLSL